MEARCLILFGFCVLLIAVPSRARSSSKVGLEENFSDVESEEFLRIDACTDSQSGATDWKKGSSSWLVEIDSRATGYSTKYCIERIGNAGINSTKGVDIMWKIVDDSRMTLAVVPFDNWGITEYSSRRGNVSWETTKMSFAEGDRTNHVEPKCDMYLELGCRPVDKSSSSSRTLPRKFDGRVEKELVAMDSTEGFTDNELSVDRDTEQLRIVLSGKSAQAVMHIPIAAREDNSAVARTPSPTLSLSRTSDGKGVHLDARNPSPGGWRLTLLGVENSNYSMSLVTVSGEAAVDNLDADTSINASSRTKDVTNSNEQLRIPQPPIYQEATRDGRSTSKSVGLDNRQILVGKELSDEVSMSEPRGLELSMWKEGESVESMDEKISMKFPRKVNPQAEVVESDLGNKAIGGRSASDGDTAKIVNDSELEALSRSVGEGQTSVKKTVVDISPNAQLIARPGFHDIVFTVTNNQPLGIRYAFQARSSQFTLIAILPYTAAWIRAGETVEVIVRIQVPTSQDNALNVVTLYVGGNENLEVVEKSTYVYVQGSSLLSTSDTDKPSIDYSFNDNCNGKLNRDRCNKSLWSVEITVKDADSGLKTVTSLPKGAEARTEFVAGTKNSVSFYYVSSCCYTTVDVKATDVQGNTYTRTIDVTDWDNLSQGEIAAIVVGALLILLVIILLILLIIYCVRKRQSHDLSFSQRYGSRNPTSTERSNF